MNPANSLNIVATSSRDQLLIQVARTHLREGRLPQAQVLVGAWLQRSPNAVNALAVQAQLELMGGNLQQAHETAQKAAALDPHNAHAAFALGQTFLVQNQPDQATPNLERAHMLAPQDAEIACAIAQLQLNRQQVDAASRLLRRFTSGPQAYAPAKLLLAETQLNHADDLEEVLQLTQEVCSDAPHLAAAWVIHGLALASLGDIAAARDRLELALCLEPDQPAFLLSLAQLTLQDPASSPEQIEQACTQAQRATAVASQDWRGPWLLGRLLRRQRKITAALKVLAQAGQSFAQQTELWVEICLCCLDAGQARAGEDALAKAKAIAPESPAVLHASWALSLRQGHWAKAHAAQESLDQATRPDARRLPAPLQAQGSKDLRGQTIGLIAAHLGHYFAYARFIAALHETSGARLCLGASPELAPLLARIAGVAEVFTGEQLSAQYIEPLSRLPLLLGLQDEAPLWDGPYLHANPAALAQARQQRAVHAGPCVLLELGLQPEPLLLRQLGYWLGQQQALVLVLSDHSTWQSTAQGATVLALDPSDFEMLAAWTAVADAVISTDAPLAHMAGAMDIPAHVLLPLTHDPLWGMAAETCAWYPRVQLLREPLTGGWHSVCSALEQRLNEMTAVVPAAGVSRAQARRQGQGAGAEAPELSVDFLSSTA
jgi:tetratricopeptide (TPR) repeat protein